MDIPTSGGPAPVRVSPHAPGLSPARARVLEYVQARPDGATIDEVATAEEHHPNTVRAHLDALVQHGLLLRTPTPSHGRGRPAWRYRANAAHREPDSRVREYAALVGALAAHIEAHSRDPQSDARAAGQRWGRDLVAADGAAGPGVTDDAVAGRPRSDGGAAAGLSGSDAEAGRAQAGGHAETGPAQAAQDLEAGRAQTAPDPEAGRAQTAPGAEAEYALSPSDAETVHDPRPAAPPVAAPPRAGRAHSAATRSATPPAVSPPSAAAHQRVVRMLADLSFGPRTELTGSAVVLTTCPILDAALAHPQVVCAVHEGMVAGALVALGAPSDGVGLEPFARPDGCLLTLPVQHEARGGDRDD